MMKARIVSVLTLCSAVAMLLPGCGDEKKGPKLVPVVGSVSYKGKPVSGAQLTFIPMEGTEGNGGSAKADAQGKYKATYARGGDGLPAGKYKVTVSQRLMPDGSEPPEDVPAIESPAKEQLPARYSQPESTGLIRTISEGGGNVDFNLK